MNNNARLNLNGAIGFNKLLVGNVDVGPTCCRVSYPPRDS